ncbi:hypothetical protein P0W64_01860 [Tsukamurella sp. 8F]|uniref:hypothetical protein n=1 Tax=unclassified Tsukamurella TaxID=2633480 RepID=UPI0023BA3C42|nr:MULTISPECIES: hypothetical protein [unclassified Tsukamurella]MDF0528556.1 hypothetical protein [Tsukamurella sp. 8J]MDF0585518.1 hypothetical protein [Tsukamurella sp. 8F]
MSGAVGLADGIPVVEAVEGAAGAVASGDWTGGVSAGMALSTAGSAAVADPVGTIVAGGWGWVFEHVPVLRDALDWLAGDAQAIEATCAAWSEQVAVPLGRAGESLADTVEGTRGIWTGDAADAYRDAGRRLAERLGSVAIAARAAAVGIRIAGTLVLETRNLIRDMLAEFAAWLSVTCAAAVASSVPTAGSSVATWMQIATARAAALGEKVTSKLAALAPRLEAFTSHVGTLARVTERLGRVAAGLEGASGFARRVAAAPSPSAELATRLSRAASAVPTGAAAREAVAGAAPTAVVKAVGDGWKAASQSGPPEAAGADAGSGT